MIKPMVVCFCSIGEGQGGGSGLVGDCSYSG